MLTKFFIVVAAAAVSNTADARLVFLGMNAEQDDAFTVGLLAPLEAGTTLRFRDDEWSGAAFNDEGTLADSYFSFSLSNTLPAGTILTFNDVNLPNGRHVTDGYGAAVAGTFGGPDLTIYTPLSTSNEGLYAYIGPDFDTVSEPLASIRTGVLGGTLFGTRVDFAGVNGADGKQVGNSLVYTGPLSIDGPYEDFVPLVTDLSNWAVQDSFSDPISPYTPPSGVLSAVATIPEPTAALFGALLAGALGVTIARRPAARG